MRWNPQVGRCWHAFVNPSGKIELGTMARAEKAATPVFGRSHLEILQRSATEVCTRALNDQIFGPNRARVVSRILRLLLNDSESGSLSLIHILGRRDNISSVRRSTKTSLPRHRTRTISPGCIEPIGTSTGAPKRLRTGAGLQRRKKRNSNQSDASGASNQQLLR